MNKITEEKLNKIKEEFKGNLVDYIDELKKKAELADHYKHLYSEVKKQKDDLIKSIKHIKSILEEYNYEPYRVNTALEDLLRMLGEKDE